MDEQSAQPGAAPPIVRPRASINRESVSWPTAIGSIAIVIAGLGMTMGLWAALIGTRYRGAVPTTSAGVPDFDRIHDATRTLNLVNFGLSIGLGIVLIAGGIGLTYRRSSSVPLLLVWAVARLVAGVVVLIWNIQLRGRFMSGGATTAVMGGPWARFDPVFDMVLTGALPVLVLIWFFLPSVREEVARWRARSARARAGFGGKGPS